MKTRLTWAALLVVICLVWLGCGKKTPPVSPTGLKLRAVEDLAAKAEGCNATLSWTIPSGGDDELLTGFDIYGGTQQLSGPLCPDCPVTFWRTDRLRLDQLTAVEKRDGRIVYRKACECGNRYFFKVVGFTDGNVLSPESNVVRIELQPPAEKAGTPK
ncbi:MAG: hypothetical protein ACOZF0_01135 [Thermodesulfobacteriota bacterium]